MRSVTLEQTVELFCGKTKAFSEIAGALGFKTYTVDSNPLVVPSLVADVRTVTADQMPKNPFIVWAAPPGASAFNDASAWERDGSFSPKTAAAAEAIELFRKTVTLIATMKPTWWFIENPKSLLRKMPTTAGFNRGHPTRIRQTINSDQYGGSGAREVDIWCNAYWWLPRPGPTAPNEFSNSGRRIPPFALSEMFQQLESYLASKTTTREI